MYKAIFDSRGNRITSYRTDIHTNIPSEAIEISDADQALYATNEYIRGVDGKPQKKPAYVPTIEETLVTTKATKLAEIKAKLAATDYKCLKYVDGELTEIEYTETKTLRSSLRAAYNMIEVATTLEEVNAVNY